MRRQVGELPIRERGKDLRGLIICYLVKDPGIAVAGNFGNWATPDLTLSTHVKLMGQSRREHRAEGHSEISKRVTGSELR